MLATNHFTSLTGEELRVFLLQIIQFHHILISIVNLFDIVTIFKIIWGKHSMRVEVQSRVLMWCSDYYQTPCHSICIAPCSLTYSQIPWHPLLCVPQKCNAEHLAKLFFWKANIIFSSPNFLLRCVWVFFLWKVKALIKASWKYFMIEMKVEWLKEKKISIQKNRKQDKLIPAVFFKPFWWRPTEKKTIYLTMQYLLPTMPSDAFYPFHFFKNADWYI